MPPRLALFSLLAVSAIPISASARPIDIAHPIIPLISDLLPCPGEVVQVTVPFSAPASVAGTVSINSTTLGNFDSLVSSVNYNAGDSSVTFYVQIDPLALGFIEITATVNGASTSITEMLLGLPMTNSSTTSDFRF